MTEERKSKSNGEKYKYSGSRKSKFVSLFMFALIVSGIFFITSCGGDCEHENNNNNSDSLLTSLKNEYQMKNDELEKKKKSVWEYQKLLQVETGRK